MMFIVVVIYYLLYVFECGDLFCIKILGFGDFVVFLFVDVCFVYFNFNFLIIFQVDFCDGVVVSIVKLLVVVCEVNNGQIV